MLTENTLGNKEGIIYIKVNSTTDTGLTGRFVKSSYRLDKNMTEEVDAVLLVQACENI